MLFCISKELTNYSSDIYVAQIIVLAFELDAYLRGAHRRRFLHLGSPVTVTVKPFDSTTAPIIKQKSFDGFFGAQRFKTGASRLGLESGFLVKQESEQVGDVDDGGSPTSVKKIVRIFVNQVELKQADALAVHLLGYRTGKLVFTFVSGWRGRLLVTLAYVWASIVLLTFPLLNSGDLPSWFPLTTLFSIGVLVVCRISMLSRTMLGLLIRRRQFIVSIVFILCWFGMICAVLQDERITIVIFTVLCSLLEIVSDAKVTILNTRTVISKTWEKLAVGLLFGILAVFMVFGVIQSRQLYVVFRPDLVQGQISSDSPFVVDEFQAAVDLQLSFFLERVMGAFLYYRRHQPEVLQLITSPVLPKQAKEKKDISVGI